MTDDSVIIILERKKAEGRNLCVCKTKSAAKKEKTFLTLKSSGVKEVVLRQKG